MRQGFVDSISSEDCRRRGPIRGALLNVSVYRKGSHSKWAGPHLIDDIKTICELPQEPIFREVLDAFGIHEHGRHERTSEFDPFLIRLPLVSGWSLLYREATSSPSYA